MKTKILIFISTFLISQLSIFAQNTISIQDVITKDTLVANIQSNRIDLKAFMFQG